MTQAALSNLYLAEGAGHKKPATLKADRGRIRNHILPLLASRRIDQIARADVERLVRDVSAGKTAAPAPKHPGRGQVARGWRRGGGASSQASGRLVPRASKRRVT